ncbi:diguanylate cyclase [Pseudoalteromonas sp. MMG010]|uniref:GGDEF domain-containing protein n=1 Tax=Pseudoalteromonas sp. MMG010 TaxID=2822685 RepID=UPI001B3A3FF3|nr:GGDEF domain-containing protein [Pseudoalteromonas sp. MMG010]MBQ4833409.1 diguanylate cyclase [Pseudoalteromonas sp. MMG010]
MELSVQDNSNVTNQKLKQAIEARIAIEDARKFQVDKLSQLAAKLSLCSKGIDIQLDNKLAKFRTALTKGIDFELLIPMIDNIMHMLQSQEKIQLSQQQALFSSVQNAGKQLQKTKKMPEETRRVLRNLLDHELANVHSTPAYIPLLDKLVNIYHEVLKVKLEIISESKNETANPALAKKLLQLSNELKLEDNAAKQIIDIQNDLAENDSLDSLLNSAIAIIQIVVKNISKERQSAQNFLVSLNQTIEELHVSIVSTRTHSESMNQEFKDLNSKIESKIKNLNIQTQKATSISALKEIVDNELKSLSQDFLAKEKLEQAERDTLIDSFKNINEHISNLESKLTKYKKRLNEQRSQSLIDSLTKLPNRAAFDERYNHEIHLYNMEASDLTLVVIDVDHFKSINDRFGHSAGDITLQVISKALQKSIRKSDFIARYGGEEFVLLMPGTPLEFASIPLEKLRKTIKAIPFKFKDTQIQITISLGATQLKSGDTQLDAFNRADDALYTAKNSGRDRLCLSK